MLQMILATALVFAAGPATKAPAKKSATPPPAQATPAPAPVGQPVSHFSNAPAILHITSEKMMAMVLVDGTPLEQSDCTSPKACAATDLSPGPHEIEVRGGAFGTKPIFKGMVTVTGGSEMWGKAKDNQFTIYNTQARTDLGPAPVAVVAAQPVSATHVTTTTTTVNNGAVVPGGGVSMGMSFTDPDTGETVNMGVSAGAFGSTATVTEQTTVTTTVNGATAAPVAVSGKSGILELTSQDGESFTVFLDGKKVGTFNGLEGDSIKVKNVTPGEHKLVIKDFMENDVWTSGRLLMDPGFTLKLGVDEQGVEVFNRQAAWRPGF